MRNILVRSISLLFPCLFLSMGCALSARASCGYVAGGLQEKMAAFTAFRKINQATFDKLIATENHCLSQGSTVSSRIAAAADAESCKGELDASGMNKKMSEIGARCTAVFSKINELHLALQSQFDQVQGDLELGTKMLRKSRILSANCGAEIGAASKMVKSFLALEAKVIATQARSLDGKVSYGKFTKVAKELEATTLARGEGCGQMAAAFSRALSGVGAGSKATIPSGKPAGSGSDITGTEQDKAKRGKP